MTRRVAFLAVLLMCGVGATVCLAADGPAATAKPAKELTADQVKALIAKLADSDFKVRDAAQKELAAAGPSALPALEQAAKSGDSEVKQRAELAIREIKASIADAVSQELAKNYLWSCTLDKGAITGPSVAGGMAYVIAQDWKLHAVDVKTGKEIWAVDTAVKGMGQVSAGEKVVVVTLMNTMTAYDVKDGKQLWQKEDKAAAPRMMNPPIRAVPLQGNPGPGASAPASGPAPVRPPAAAGGGAGFVARPGAIVAGGPFPIAMGRPQAWVVGDVVVAFAEADKLKAYKALTGEDAWELEVKGRSMACAPVVVDGVLYVAKEKFVAAIDLTSRKELWSKDLEGCTMLALGGKTLYSLAGGKLVAFDAKKGEKAWEADMPVAGGGAQGAANVPANMPVAFGGAMGGRNLIVDETRAYVVVGDELTIFDSQKGDKTTAKLDVSLPQKDGEKDPTGGAASTVIIQGGAAAGGIKMGTTTMAGQLRFTAAGGVLYGANNAGLFAFDGKTGQRLWVLPVSQRIVGDPAIFDAVVYFATAKMYGMDRGQPTPDEKALPKDLPGVHALKMPK